MPTTLVDLCNMALAHLRQRPVTGDAGTVYGDTPEAVNCRRFFEIAMREALRAYDWSFARQYFPGIKIPAATVPNWRYVYEMPPGIEIVRYVAQNDRTEAPVRFRIMRTGIGGPDRQAVFTNEDAAWLVCTVYVSDPTLYPADFVEFASYVLAAHLAMPITGKADLMMGMRKIAEDAGKRAAITATNSETEDEGESAVRATPLPAAQQVDIANAALSMLGQPAIVGFGDRTRQGDTVRRFYRQAVDMSLRLFDWPFARLVVAGVKAVASPVPNWQFAYTMPTCAAVRYIMRSSEDEQPVRYQILRPAGVGGTRLIYTNEDNARFVVTGLVEDPAEWPQDFVQLVASNLAQLMALPLTGKADVLKAMMEAAEMSGKLAITSAGTEEGEQEGADAARDEPLTNATSVQIANIALGMLGQEAIQSFGERTARANNARRFYRLAVDMSLRLFDWPFARVFVAGDFAGPSNSPNWLYTFRLPDCAAFRHIALSPDAEEPIRYQIMRYSVVDVQRLVYTNERNPVFVITGKIEDPSQWPQDFVQLVAANLARLMAVPLTGKVDAEKAMSDAAEAAGKLAIMAATTEEGEQAGADARRDLTPSAAVPVDIANLALGLIGQDAILNFGERTPRANAVRKFYALALRATLRSVDWPFARTYVAATPSNGPAVMTGWRYAYAYPANCAAVRGFAKRYPTDYDARFQVVGGDILCNKPLQTLIYTRWDVDPTAYDPEFTTLLAHELAALIAVPLTGKNEAATYLRQVAKGLRDKARADAANESPEELDERVPDWLAVRGVPSLTREDREHWGGGGYGWDRLGGPWGGLPGSGPVNPTPPMITGPGPGSAILPAYIPGLTAPVEPTPQLLSSSDFWVESVGGRIERDGVLVIDDPSQEYIEADYDIQEDN